MHVEHTAEVAPESVRPGVTRRLSAARLVEVMYPSIERSRAYCQDMVVFLDRPEPTPVPMLVSPPLPDMGVEIVARVMPRRTLGAPPLETIEGMPLLVPRASIQPGAMLGQLSMIDADLRGAKLAGADLSGADLSGANLAEADLQNAQMRGTVLDGAILVDACLDGCDLKDAVMRRVDLRRASLRDANLDGVAFDDARLMVVDLRGSAVSYGQLVKVRLPKPSRELLNRIWNWDFSHAQLLRKDLVAAVRARRYPWVHGVRTFLHDWGSPHWNRGRSYVEDANIVELREIVDEVLRFLMVATG